MKFDELCMIITESVANNRLRNAKNIIKSKLGGDVHSVRVEIDKNTQNPERFSTWDDEKRIAYFIKDEFGISGEKLEFLPGVVRLYMDEMSKNDSAHPDTNELMQFKQTFKLLKTAHENEYDDNLNGLSIGELNNRFKVSILNNYKEDKEKLKNIRYDENESEYTIVLIDSFEKASEYSKYTTWCITHERQNYDGYTNGGMCPFYFCLKNGFENVEDVPGQNAPLDEYGLSMIAVCVNENGSLKTCTCRWNHDKGGNDNIMNTKQISEVVKRNFYDVFKPYDAETILKKYTNLHGRIIRQENLYDDKNNEVNGFQLEDGVVIVNNGFTYIETHKTKIPGYYCSDVLLHEKDAEPIVNIPTDAFESCESLTSITIPNSVTRIGHSAFLCCKSLTSITIPNSVKSIGVRAFSGCESLASITIPNSVTEMEEGVFSGCRSFTSITIPNSVTKIGDAAFSGCESITSITIPDSVTEIGGYVFDGCESLTSITIPDSVKSIGDKAFYECKSLTSITIPNSVNDIYDDVFGGCESLRVIYISGKNDKLYRRIKKEVRGKKVDIRVIDSKDGVENTNESRKLDDLCMSIFYEGVCFRAK